MKKSLLMLASLALGTAAIAQTTPSSPTPDQAANPPASDPSATPAAAPAPDPAMSSNTAAPAPAPTDSSTSAAPAPVDTSSYPVCSRTVTDKCVQKGAMRHHK